MASRKVEVSIVGDARSLERAFGRAGRSASGFDKSVSKLGAVGMGVLAGGAAAATLAIGRGLANAMRDGVREFQAQAKVSAQTAAALKSTGMAAGVTQQHIEDMSSAIQEQTGLADDAVQGAQNLLLTFTKISNAGPDKMFDRATRATADLSVAFSKDLNSSAILVGKALNDPIKGVSALTRVGVSFTTAQKETIKSLVETGHAAEAQKLILKELETQVGESAKAFGDSTPGLVAKAQRAYEDMTESIAGALVPAFLTLMPLVTKAMTAIAPVVEKAAKAIAELASELLKSEEFQSFAASIKEIAVQGINVLVAALKVVLPLIIGIAAPLAAMAAGILNSQAAMTALVAVLSAFVALKVANAISDTASAMRKLAITSGTVGVLNQLGNALSLASFGFKGVSAQAIGLAPGLTAAQAGLSRTATAGKMAGGAFKAFGGAAMAAAGGPWVVAIAAGTAVATTLATVIGGDLISSFRGAGSAIDQVKDSLQSFTQAQQATQTAQGAFMTSMLSYTDAIKQETEARKKATEATRAADAARAQYGAGSPQAQAAAQQEAAANRGLSGAIAQVESTRTSAASNLQGYITGLRTSGDAVRNMTTKLVGAVAPMGLVNTKTKEGADAMRRHQRAVELAYAAVGKTGQFKAAQDGLNKLADYLKGLGPKYQGVAREAQRVADMKPGPGQQAAYDKLIGKLEKMAGKIAGVPQVKIKADGSQAQQVIDSIKRKLDDLERPRTAQVTVNEVQGTRAPRKGDKREGSIEESNKVWKTLGPQMRQTFFAVRQQVAGAVAGLASMFGQARRAIYSAQQSFSHAGQTFSGSLNDKVRGLSDRQAARQEKSLIANRDRLQNDASATQEERQAAQDELDDFYTQREIERQQAAIDDAVQGDERAMTSLTNRFKRGEIDAGTFQTELDKLIGGETGATLGVMFGDEWASGLLEAVGSIKDEFWRALGLDQLLQPEGDASGMQAARYQDNAPYREWRKKRGDFIRARRAAMKDGLTEEERKALKSRFGADDLDEWEDRNPMPRRFATGGIVTGLTPAIIGEAGPEAVIPLEGPRARRMLRGAGVGGSQVTLVFNGVLDAKDAARVLRPELDRLVRLAA